MHQIISQAANALKYLHGCRVVHRDIKSDNFVVSTVVGNEIKVLSWLLIVLILLMVWMMMFYDADDDTTALVSMMTVAMMTTMHMSWLWSRVVFQFRNDGFNDDV